MSIPWPGIVAGSKQFKAFMGRLGPMEAKMVEEAERDWGMKYGGLIPGPNEFGRTSLMPPLFETEWGRPLSTWMRDFKAPGERVIMKGASSGRIPNDFRLMLMGLLFMGRRGLIVEWWLETDSTATERRKPVISPEDFPMVNGLKEPLSLKEGQKLKIKGRVRKGGGRIRVIPIGYVLYKRNILDGKDEKR